MDERDRTMRLKRSVQSRKALKKANNVTNAMAEN
jgi:hypothetical protein